VFTNGHMGPWHLLALENAARAVSRRYRVHAIAPAASLLRDFILRRLLMPAVKGDMTEEDQVEFFNAHHGGMLETSVMMAIHPEMVKPSYTHLPRLPRSAMLNWRGRQSTAWAGYLGSPARAMAAWGEITIDRVADAGAELILRVVDRGRKESAHAHLFPRVPFSMAARRWGVLATAATVGAGVALLATRIIGRERAATHE
ncbi:MAG TPA: creatininase family protein, partial [Ktedonobacterales bacterium]|nr:creatininase family protein [Ktedonobacterales bacterium]